MNNDQYQNPLDILNHNGNDSIMQAARKYVTAVYNERDSIIESHIRKIGGTEFEETTIDHDKVIEALTMYRDKDQYEKIRHAMWYNSQHEFHSTCSYCGRLGYNYYKFCPHCGARMDEEKK